MDRRVAGGELVSEALHLSKEENDSRSLKVWRVGYVLK